jgi:hypothetical protein
MVASYYGHNVTPATLNDKMKEAGGFSGPYIKPALAGAVLPGFRMVSYSACENQPAPLAEIDAYLAQGKPVIVAVDSSPQAGVQTHFMVVTAKKGDDYVIQDPYPNPAETKEVLLTQRYGGKYGRGKTAQETIQNVTFYDGAPVTPPAPPKLDKGVKASFKVYASVEDLAIRSQTVVSDATLLKRMPINTEFTVLEADAAAKTKIGQNNQWLAVKAPDGLEGYVAAWYVTLDQTAATKPTAAVPVPSNAPVVKTTTDGVALRSRPETTEASLIKRLPTGAELKVITPVEEANRKVGVMYEWLQVADVQSAQGVVAAWYVTPVSGLTVGPQKERAPGQPSFTIGEEAPPVYVRAAQEGLALRSEPIITIATVIKRLPKDAEMLALEPPDTAAPKIGRMGDWLHVRDVTGDEGYVAAWCVLERPGDPDPSATPRDC